MAGWLEQFEGIGKGLLDVAGEGASKQLERAVSPREAPDSPEDRPEQQYDVTVVEPESGPEARTSAVQKQMRDALDQYKWWAAGGLALVAFMAWRGAR